MFCSFSCGSNGFVEALEVNQQILEADALYTHVFAQTPSSGVLEALHSCWGGTFSSELRRR